MQKSIDLKGNKSFRLLNIYERISKGESIKKDSLSKEFCVSRKTIQRDISDLRLYLSEIHPFDIETDISYNKIDNSYFLKRYEIDWLTNKEILIISMILLRSGSLEKNQMLTLIDKLIRHSTYEDGKLIESIINEDYYKYISINKDENFLNNIWNLLEFIKAQKVISFSYSSDCGGLKKYMVKPITIIFNKPLFYLISYLEVDGTEIPKVFQINRMKEIKVTGKSFRIPYSDKINVNEFYNIIKYLD